MAEAKARVLGDEARAEAQSQDVAPTPAAPVAAAAHVAPEPLLLPRDGVAKLVEDTVARSKAAESRPLPPVEALGGSRGEPEPSPAFVPFEDRGGSIASGPTRAPEGEVGTSRTRTRTRPKLARPVEDEPCEPSLSAPIASPEPAGGWVCGPCGRG